MTDGGTRYGEEGEVKKDGKKEEREGDMRNKRKRKRIS